MIVLGLNDVLIYTSKQTPHTNNSLLYYHLIIFIPLTDITDLFVKASYYSSYSFEFHQLRFVDEVPHFTHYKCSYHFDLIDLD